MLCIDEPLSQRGDSASSRGSCAGRQFPRPTTGSGGPSGQPPPRFRIGSPRSFVAFRLWNHAYAFPWRFSAYRRLSTAAVYPKSSLSRGRQPPGIYLIRNLAKRIPRVVRKLREEKRKPPEESGGKRKSRRLPIFPGRFQPSILGASGLNCRVRDGNGCTPTAIGTDYIPLLRVSYTLRTEQRKRRKGPQKGFCNMISRCRSSPRSISTAKLKTSPSLHMQPIYQVVFLGPYLITQWDI